MATPENYQKLYSPFNDANIWQREQMMYRGEPISKPKVVSQTEFFEVMQELCERYREHHEVLTEIDAEIAQFETQKRTIEQSIEALKKAKASNPLIRIQDMIGSGIRLEPGQSLPLDNEK